MASITPVPEWSIVPPEPTVMVAVVLEPVVMAENADPPPATPQAPPALTRSIPFEAKDTQSPEVCALETPGIRNAPRLFGFIFQRCAVESG